MTGKRLRRYSAKRTAEYGQGIGAIFGMFGWHVGSCPVFAGAFTASAKTLPGRFPAFLLGGHEGTDIAAKRGSNIAAASGTVLRAIDTKGSNGYGNTVVLDHGNGYQTVYAHCQEILVQAGDAVNQGDVITLVGTTGLTTGSHCHLELRLNGEK